MEKPVAVVEYTVLAALCINRGLPKERIVDTLCADGMPRGPAEYLVNLVEHLVGIERDTHAKIN